MFTKGNTVYAEAYKYLRSKAVNMVALQTKGSPDDFTEENFSLPLKVSVESKTVKFGPYFMVRVKALDYATIKTAIIKLRYSNDDQMALILNKDSSPEDALLYAKMQAWRDFAADVARLAEQSVKDQESRTK